MTSDDAAAQSVAPPVEAAQFSGGRDEQAPAVEPKRSPWADLPHPMPRHAVTLDVATLQTARNSMLMADESHRQRKLASAR